MTTKIEFFFGTGGVGKTTLGTARALHLSKSMPTLLITIDPSWRLKQLLHLEKEQAGLIHHLKDKSVIADMGGDPQNLSAQLMSSSQTLKKYFGDKATSNSILQLLADDNGGMNEILALVELHKIRQTNTFSAIVVDTAPGQHFIDFLQAAKKINRFFDSRFVDTFMQIEKQFSKQNNKGAKSAHFFSKIAGAGLDLVFDILEKMTGKDFIKDFIEATRIVYSEKETFLASLSFFDQIISSKNEAQFFLVTAADQAKTQEIQLFLQKAQELIASPLQVIINKTLAHDVAAWLPEDPLTLLLKNQLLDKEQKLKNDFSSYDLTLFPENLEENMIIKMRNLTSLWP
jgi:anion-transporting  ArsA/GET3 family ATPase